MARSRSPASSPLSPRATAWQAAASAPKRSETFAAGNAANWPSVVIPRRCRVTARSGRASVATDHGARKSAVPPGGTISSERAASTAAKSPSATPILASSPTLSRSSRSSRLSTSSSEPMTAARRATTASSPPKKRAGPRAGSAPTPSRTGCTHGHSSPARARTRAKRRASSPRGPSSRSSGHQMTTNRSTASPPLSRFCFTTAWLMPRRPHGRRCRRRHRAGVGGQPQRALGRPAGGAATAHAHLGAAAAQVPVAATDALPLDRPHRQGQVAALGPAPRSLEQHDQCGLAVAGPGGEMARRGEARPAGRAHQDGVDTGKKVAGRLGPARAGVGHEDDPAQIEPEAGRRDHAGVGQADGGTPAPRRPTPRPGGRAPGWSRRGRAAPRRWSSCRGAGSRWGRAGPAAGAPAGSGRRPASWAGPGRPARRGAPGEPAGSGRRGVTGSGDGAAPVVEKANICSYLTEAVRRLLGEPKPQVRGCTRPDRAP